MAFSAKLVIYSKSNISFIISSSMSQCGHSLFSSTPHIPMFHRDLHKIRDLQTEGSQYKKSFLVAFVYHFAIFVKNYRIMSQSAFTIRLDSDLKEQFDRLCEEFGMSASTAFNVYVRQVVRTRSIPFAIEADTMDDVREKARKAFFNMRKSAADNGISGMSLDEINEEIRLTREGK